MAMVDVLLHPVRLRVVQALLDGRPLTTRGIQELVADVPPATLYRHVATLVEAGVLEVVDEQRVRGAVERTYRLRRGAASLDTETLAGMTRADHRRAFTAFMAGLLAGFDRYLDRAAEPDLPADGVGYRQVALWLTDDELSALAARLNEAVLAQLDNEPAPGRVRRLLTTVLMPASG